MPPIDQRVEDEWRKRRRGLVEELGPQASLRVGSWPLPDRRSLTSLSAGRPNPGRSVDRTSFQADHDSRHDMRQRFLGLATGASPAVVKVVGFGAGGNARRLVSYISRSGETRIENERGNILHGAAVPVQVAGEWSDRMPPRNQTSDVARFEIEVDWRTGEPRTGVPTIPGDHLVRQAFHDRSFAFATLETTGSTRVSGIVVLNSVSEGRLLPDNVRADTLSLHVMNAIGLDAAAVHVRFESHGHGTHWGAAALRALVEQFPDQVRDDRNEPIGTAQAASRLVQTHWRPLLGSHAPRDTLHLVMSAGRGHDPRRFEDSVRDFLKQEFKGHRYVFAIHDPQHDPKPQAEGGKRQHLHAHVIVATRSDYDDRLNVWVKDLNRWRSTFSEAARGNGINLEIVARGEVASSRAYTHKQIRPVSFAGRTEYVGTSPAGQRRYEAKRSERPVAATGQVGKAQAKVARQTWEDLTRHTYSAPVRAYAQSMLARFDEAERLTSGQTTEASATTEARAQGTSEPQRHDGVVASNTSDRSRASEVSSRITAAQGHAASVEPNQQVASSGSTKQSRSDGRDRTPPHLPKSTPAEHAASTRARDDSRAPGGPGGSDGEGPGSLGLAAASLVAAFNKAWANKASLDAFEIDAARFHAKQKLERQLITMGDVTEGRAGEAARARQQARMADGVDRSDQAERPTTTPRQQRPDQDVSREVLKDHVRQEHASDRSRSSGRDDYER